MFHFHQTSRSRGSIALYFLVTLVAVAATIGVLLLLQNIFKRQREAEQVVFKLVDLDNETIDPATWGKNFPRQYDAYLRTADFQRTRYGGSEAFPQSKLDADPNLVKIFAGYAFGVDYRMKRGHAYMLQDQENTKRVKDFKQPGACIHCHASNTVAYRNEGVAAGVPAQPKDQFNWPAVMKGFELMNKKTYKEAHDIVGAHPVACVDCHTPETMQLRVTRPGFVTGIAALAKSNAPVPHLPSIERWREGSRQHDYDPNVDASRQEMRSFVCGQCHVEYYCGPKVSLFFPWGKGLTATQIEEYYDNYKFPDGHTFFDWKHTLTGAEVLKAQHPEFETWSQGIHARSGVSCADCHMPYKREGAIKISDHNVRSPLLNIAASCQTCHRYPESEILSRVTVIQDRTKHLLDNAEVAVVALITDLEAAKKAGATDEQLATARQFQRKAQWRTDFVNAENSMGFHAPQETAKNLAEAIDFARQGQIELMKITRGITASPAATTQPAAPQTH